MPALALAIAALALAIFSAATGARRRARGGALGRDRFCANLRQRDALTGLPNRRVLEARLARCERRELALLSIDFDRFRQVSDLFGRDCSELLLAEAAQRLLAAIGGGDLAVRLNGDEFAILHQGPHPAASAVALADRLLASLRRPFLAADQVIFTGASIGVALGSNGKALLRDAETALHAAKAEGGGRVSLFEPGMRSRREARRALEVDLRGAIETRQFVLHYQPLYAGAGTGLTGFEALIRWQHPSRGLVGPNEFIPTAEKSGLIGDLGQWVLETACREAASWPEPLRVSVNLSPRHLRDDLVAQVAQALRQAALPGRRLELEVTEGALIDDPAQAQAVLRRLRAMGVQIALDDFGTGYSSLSYLQRFPFDRIKIDRSFVENLETDPDARSIVRAVIGLGHSLRASVVAEGVETPGQMRVLLEQHCDQFQGFLLGCPLPVHEVAALLHKLQERAPKPRERLGVAPSQAMPRLPEAARPA